MDIGVEKVRLEDIARKIAVARLDDTFNRFPDKKLIDKIVGGKRKVKFISTIEAPIFTHAEINDFYKYSVEKFPKNNIEKIISLPKETLIPDLEKVVEDGMKRWDEVFYEKDFSKNTHEFLIHAMYFLAALKAEKSLPKVLDLLRMENEFIEYWFADYAEHYFYPVLYYLAENHLDELKQFATERDISSYHRLHAAQIVSQVILHQPERRGEGINWFKDVFEHHLQNENDRHLIDTDFIGISIGYVTDFRGVELIPLIEKMWNNKWICETFQGDINEIKKEINEPPHPYELDPLPLNIFEFYSGEYRRRKAPPPERISASFGKLKKNMNNKAEKLNMKQYDNLLSKALSGFDEDDFENDYGDFYTPPKQVKRESPKVGRNDPCPCGSGKKFKKCCMNK